MKLIIITSEGEIEGETLAVNSLFESGLELLHFRKPDFTKDQIANWINDIEPIYRERVVWHDHFEIAIGCGSKRFHLNRRSPEPPAVSSLILSRSCHQIGELKDACLHHSYVFLSPVFNSISKSGYPSNFAEKELLLASEENLINDQVIALGGITPEKISFLKKTGFGGVAILGYVWGDFEIDGNIKYLIKRFQLLQNIIRG